MDGEFEHLGDVAAAVVSGLKISRPGVKVLRPQSREKWLEGRLKTVGASELPALFGVHKYLTPFELMAIKQGLYKPDFAEIDIREDSIHLPPTERGNLMEPPAFVLLRRLRPTWVVTENVIPGGRVFIDEDARMSATPDGFAVEPGLPGRAAIQIKSMTEATFKADWCAGETPEPPLSVAVQAIADATLSGCQRAYAVAIVVGWGTALYLFPVPLHKALMKKARELVADFWERIEDERPYPPDFARDGEAISAIYDEDDGTEIDFSRSNRIAEVVKLREALQARESDGRSAAKERKVLDDEIRYALGNSTRGRLADGRIVEAKIVNNRGSVTQPYSYRPVKVKEPKQGKAAG